MKKNTTLTETYKLVFAALAPTETRLRNEFKRQLISQTDRVLAMLAEDGWDAEKRFSYPTGSMSREAYRRAQALYELVHACTTGTKSCRAWKDPDIRVEKPDTFATIAKQAARMARAALEGYCHKLAAKIDDTGIACGKVEYAGGTDPWGFSHVIINSGEQRWRTRMIVNVSVYGKPFNQWPTRLIS
jgi:hypothetical protein